MFVKVVVTECTSPWTGSPRCEGVKRKEDDMTKVKREEEEEEEEVSVRASRQEGFVGRSNRLNPPLSKQTP